MKTKGYNYEINPLLESSSSDDEEAHEIQRITKKGRQEEGPVVILKDSLFSPEQRRKTEV